MNAGPDPKTSVTRPAAGPQARRTLPRTGAARPRPWTGAALFGLGLGLSLGAGAAFATAPFDVDGDGSVTAATDGQLVLRHLFGFSGTTLTDGALGVGATRDAAGITNYLIGAGPLLDLDGNGRRDALTDGLLLIRYLQGRTGEALTAGVVAPGATRDAGAIVRWIDSGGVTGFNLINDTGFNYCYDPSTGPVSCPVLGYPGQDAQYGRDLTHYDDTDGNAGFSFTKLDGSGRALPPDSPAWDCVRDNVTGLIWEQKTSDSGLRDLLHSYTWYSPDSASNGGVAGTRNGGSCAGGIECDTSSYVAAVNALGLCGAKDWRLPSPREILGILNLQEWTNLLGVNVWSRASYWSSSSSVASPGSAWTVGMPSVSLYITTASKSVASSVILVRTGQ